MELQLVLQSHRQLSRERVFLNRSDVLDSRSDSYLLENYRFPRCEILKIVQLCKPLERRTKRNNALPVHIQVLTALRFYAKATFQNDVKHIVGLSQAAVSRAIFNVSKVLCQERTKFIKFPTTADEIASTKLGFYRMNRFPNLIGIVDGTLIRIQAPPGPRERLFVGRKDGHFINVQIISNSDREILDVVSKWPGATHDAFIWRNCHIRQTFQQKSPKGYLGGDSGYPLEPWLMTPFASPSTRGQESYNKSFKKTRYIVECTIGLLKSVFRRIHKSGGDMIYSPDRACRIIVACCVLHNIRRKLRLLEDDAVEIMEEEEDEEEPTPQSDAALAELGAKVRQEIVDLHFSNDNDN